MFRTILISIVLFFVFLIGFLFWPVIWIARLFSKKAAENIAFFFVKTGCKIVCFLSAVRLDARGLENLPKDTPVLYIVNHRSIYDIVIAYSKFKSRTGFIAKKELEKIPVFSYWLKLANGLFLDRKNVREGMKTILKGITYLKEGTSMCIFPEGTRNRDTESKTSLLEFHGGSFKLAEKAEVPIVPIAFYNTAECFEAHAPKVRKTNVKMTVGKPVVLSELSTEERRFIGKYMQERMSEMMAVYEQEEK